MRKISVFLFVNSVFIFGIANTFVASHAMKSSENVFVIWKFLAYTSPPQLYMLATALKLESGIHYSFGIRNPRCGIRNPRSRIRNPSSGIRNPNTSWITSHGAKKPLGLEKLKYFCFTTRRRSERNGFRTGISHRKAQIYYTDVW